VETPTKYLDPRTLAKLQGLRLRAQHIVEGYVAGLHRSPMHGFSIEFAEHREYVPGDDLRHVDWKVYGRTDKLYLKQYEDETNLICYVLLDVSESMSYRGPGAALSKLEYAQCLAAAICWLVITQQDAASLLTFDDQIRGVVRAGSQPAHLANLLRVMEQPAGSAKTNTQRVLQEAAERLGRRGVVFVISDFFDDTAKVLQGLRQLYHRRHDVIAMQVLDPAELDFPFKRTTLFRGLEQLPEVLAEPRALRKAYLHEFQAFLQRMERGCRTSQVDYLRVRTDQSLGTALSAYMAKRMARLR
jgi:uncharacterized protein (DUF58 family)